MKLVAAFLRLVRWPNLFFIALTQSLFYFLILLPGFRIRNADGSFQYHNVLQSGQFFLLCFASICIAAAGYIINDYFDLNIDRVNKPEKLVVEKIIRRRWTIVWHLVLSVVGILISFYISWKLRNPIIGPANLGCVILLWFYSTTFKKRLLIGNVLISLLTAWVILVLYFCEFRLHRILDAESGRLLERLFKFAVLYSGFAFIISLVREVIKDMEDMEGDARYGCRTMPLVWGIQSTKIFAITWLVILIVCLIIIAFYILQFHWWVMSVYSVLVVIIPCVGLLRQLQRANTKEDYHALSNRIKMVMLAGILSMSFFLMYYL